MKPGHKGKLKGLPAGFYFTPESAVISWQDATGKHEGNLEYIATNIDAASTLEINAQGKGLTAFTIGTEFPKLMKLTLSGNLISEVILSACLALKVVEVNDNPITSLDVRMLSRMIKLDCSGCRLSGIDALNLNGNGMLSVLKAYNMPIWPDISQNPQIKDIDLGGNYLGPDPILASELVSNTLIKLDQFGLIGGAIAFSGTAPPNEKGRIAADSLAGKQWSLQIDRGGPIP